MKYWDFSQVLTTAKKKNSN